MFRFTKMGWCVFSYHGEPERSGQFISDEGAFGYIVLDSAGWRHQVPNVRPETAPERERREHDGYYVEEPST